MTEGCIVVRLTLVGGCAHAVQVKSTRLIGLSALFKNRAVEEAIQLVPRLFSLCAVAQQIAALNAAEAALGIPLAPMQNAARQLMVDCEALEQTLWRIQLDWPKFCGEQPAMAAYQALRRSLQALKASVFGADELSLGGAPFNPDLDQLYKQLVAIEESVYASVFGAKDYPLRDRRTFQRWLNAAPTVPAKLLNQIFASDLVGLGQNSVPLLTELNPAWLEKRLSAADAVRFCAQPEFLGQPLETGALVRCATQPLIADLLEQHGKGLGVRLTAQLAQVSDLLDTMRDNIIDMANGGNHIQAFGQKGSGVSVLKTARGLLVHRVNLNKNRVSDYQILAPTEWNFHPQGVLSQGLQGAALGGLASAERLVALFVTALDPCVDYQVIIQEAA